MSDPHRGDGAPPREVHVGPTEKKTNWLAWIALIAGILALLLALSRCNRDEGAVATTNTTAETVPANEDAMATSASPVAATGAAAGAAAGAGAGALAGTSGVGAYLAGTGQLPQSFAFEKLNFDSQSSTLRPADQGEVDSIVTALKQHPQARVRVVGYADARGSSAANLALGRARADSVKAGMVAGGIDASRIETASGGENDPVESNATASGQAENRRTELVLLTR